MPRYSKRQDAQNKQTRQNRLDRLTRPGVYETFNYVRRLTSYGVRFESYTEAHFRTTGPAGELMLAVAAWIAQQDAHTKARLQRAKRQGQVLGRPARSENFTTITPSRSGRHTISRRLCSLLRSTTKAQQAHFVVGGSNTSMHQR
jgi:DNA invertase Pin-like site-specific DNA recombinase